ncbi:MAG: PilZ domain-containing protein [Dehalococcoidia bacterium]|nr:PilZ domain-containing protein [Dehalococcoidia bacterium]
MEIDADAGASVFLVVSGRSTPLVVNGTLVSIEGGQIVVDLENAESVTPSEPTSSPAPQPPSGERRSHPRYPTWLDATVHAAHLQGGYPAIVTDLSVQGASVEIDEWHGDSFFRLMLNINGEEIQVECECVHQEPTWRGVLVHTRFVLVSREQFEFLEAVVAALRSVFGEAQESLVQDRPSALLM